MSEGALLQFWPFIKVHMEQQAMSNLEISRHVYGKQPPVRKKKYVNIDTRLFDIMNNYFGESETKGLQHLDDITAQGIFNG